MCEYNCNFLSPISFRFKKGKALGTEHSQEFLNSMSEVPDIRMSSDHIHIPCFVFPLTVSLFVLNPLSLCTDYSIYVTQILHEDGIPKCRYIAKSSHIPDLSEKISLALDSAGNQGQ